MFFYCHIDVYTIMTVTSARMETVKTSWSFTTRDRFCNCTITRLAYCRQVLFIASVTRGYGGPIYFTGIQNVPIPGTGMPAVTRTADFLVFNSHLWWINVHVILVSITSLQVGLGSHCPAVFSHHLTLIVVPRLPGDGSLSSCCLDVSFGDIHALLRSSSGSV